MNKGILKWDRTKITQSMFYNFSLVQETEKEHILLITGADFLNTISSLESVLSCQWSVFRLGCPF